MTNRKIHDLNKIVKNSISEVKEVTLCNYKVDLLKVREKEDDEAKC